MTHSHPKGAIATFERTLSRPGSGRARSGLRRPASGSAGLTGGIEKEAALRAALTRRDKGILKIAAEHKVGSSVVQRIKRELVVGEKPLPSSR
jgi:hypothetical protein